MEDILARIVHNLADRVSGPRAILRDFLPRIVRPLVSADWWERALGLAEEIVREALNEAARHVIAQGWADGGRVCIYGGSFGGFSIVALMIQDRWGIQAGYIQLAVDVVIFAAAALILAPETLFWSFLGAATFSLFLAINHRRDRYIAA
jgi:hypothetical protein